MSEEKRKLVTIVTEAAVESRLLRDLEMLGAKGYTITDARGKGSRGIREAGWDTSTNIRIEIVCNAATASAISRYLREHYYANYGMILYTADVEVMRGEKF
jgi:nitrogen regulatory protein PII